jgi:hypothetical protein
MHPTQLTRDKISHHPAMIASPTDYITAVAVLAFVLTPAVPSEPVLLILSGVSS